MCSREQNHFLGSKLVQSISNKKILQLGKAVTLFPT